MQDRNIWRRLGAISLVALAFWLQPLGPAAVAADLPDGPRIAQAAR